MEKDLKNKTIPELTGIINGYKEKSFLAKSIFNWIQDKGVERIEQMTTLSKELRQKLTDDKYFIGNLHIVKKQVDADGTIKYLFNLADKSKIETVLLDDEGRKTLCISSQVGCKMDCAFCATGSMHFKRDLTAGEIVDQVIQVVKDQGKPIQNIVYMGMGEPLDNYSEVMRSVRMLNDPQGKNIGARHLTISTCGIIPGIQKLAGEDMQLRLAVSLHGHTDFVRDQIMQINKRYPVADLIKTVREYQKKTGRRVTFEYVLLKDVNDSREHARGLLKLINGIRANVNLIEYNPHSAADFQPSDRKTMKDFRWIIADRGFEVCIRFKRGQGIKAACGQLGLLESKNSL